MKNSQWEDLISGIEKNPSLKEDTIPPAKKTKDGREYCYIWLDISEPEWIQMGI